MRSASQLSALKVDLESRSVILTFVRLSSDLDRQIILFKIACAYNVSSDIEWLIVCQQADTPGPRDRQLDCDSIEDPAERLQCHIDRTSGSGNESASG